VDILVKKVKKMNKYCFHVIPFDEFNQLFMYNLLIDEWEEFRTVERYDELYLSIPPSMLGLFPYTDRFIITDEWAGTDYFKRWNALTPGDELPEYTKTRELLQSHCKEHKIEVLPNAFSYPPSIHPYVINFTKMTRLIKSDKMKFLNCRKSVYDYYHSLDDYVVVDGRYFNNPKKSRRNMLFKDVILKSLQEGLKVINTTMVDLPSLRDYLLSEGIPSHVIDENYSEVKLSYEEMIACFMGAKAVFTVGNAGGISSKLFIQCNLFVYHPPLVRHDLMDQNQKHLLEEYRQWIWSDSTFGYGGTSMFEARIQKTHSHLLTSKFNENDIKGEVLWSNVKRLQKPSISESSFIDESKLIYI